MVVGLLYVPVTSDGGVIAINFEALSGTYI
jgi:hypothetical protein